LGSRFRRTGCTERAAEGILFKKREASVSILQEIVVVKREEGAKSRSASRDFLKAVHRPGRLSLIGELKKASPSKGLLRADFKADELARAYSRGGAQALSVLTDQSYFQGSLEYLKTAKEVSGLPVLRKDFLIDEIQIYEAREAGADAVLFIAALLPPAQLKEFMALARELSMTGFVEVHDDRELETALPCGVKLLGINNRDLNDFTVNLQTSLELLKKCPKDLAVVSESGIFTRQDALALQKAGASAILVGEAFMTSSDIAWAIQELMPEGE
jgi:indole-3-glycerol phosphate synthase